MSLEYLYKYTKFNVVPSEHMTKDKEYQCFRWSTEGYLETIELIPKRLKSLDEKVGIIYIDVIEAK